MTTEHHTPLTFGGPLTAAAMNAPLGQLDEGIEDVLDALAQTALPITTTDATASSGQAVVPVTSTAGFLVGQSVWIGDIAGTFETRVIASIQAGVSLTMTANLTNTYASGKIVSASPSELVEARSTFTTLAARLTAQVGGSGAAFPGSPASGDLFRRTDRAGALYRWDGAAWRQLNVPAVTAFWGTPSTDDRCYRADRDIEYFYDGTRWLSTELFELAWTPGDPSPAGGWTASSVGAFGTPWHTTYDLWLEAFYISTFVGTTNNGTNYWILTLRKRNAGGAATNITNRDTSGDAANTWVTNSVAIGALFVPATYKVFDVLLTKTLSPGVLMTAFSVKYRLVG
jgi:hypothetical protein